MSAVGEVREPSGRYLLEAPPVLARRLDLAMSSARGVKPLRQLIRSLAVKGRLTQRRQEQLSDLPPGWEWRRLTDLVVFSEAGWSPSCVEQPRREGRWGVLKVSAVSWDCFDAEANKELPSGLEPRPQ